MIFDIDCLLLKNTALYIDPATTSYVIQIVAGIVIACGTAFGIIWNKIKRKAKKNNGAEQTAAIKNKVKKGGVVTAEDLMSDDDNK